MTTVRKLWTGIIILALLSPLGVVIPSFFDGGPAWGEWSLEEVKNITGFLPEGMKELSKKWRAPLRDYTVPGLGSGSARESFGYFATGIAGLLVCAGVMYFLVRLISSGKKNRDDKHNTIK